MGRISDRGIPIMSMHEKLVALAYCIAREWNEDAARHLCDLLEHVRKKVIHPVGKPVCKDLAEMVGYYGNQPTPIEDDPVS